MNKFTKNPTVLAWIEDMKALLTPDNVVVIDGSEEQLEAQGDAQQRRHSGAVSRSCGGNAPAIQDNRRGRGQGEGSL